MFWHSRRSCDLVAEHTCCRARRARWGTGRFSK